jgi:hypothetical protein
MPTPPLTYTPEQDLFWADAVRALREGETTREQIMAIADISARTLDRRLARGREVLADVEETEDIVGGRDGEELPWVEIVERLWPDDPHYDTFDDRLQKSAGAFRIGTGNGRRLKVQHAGNGRPVEKPAKSKAKFKPKRARKG